jgi:hypothetical protein
MSLISTKGLLKGAALAVAGAAALGAGSAFAAPPTACVTGATFGTLSSPCTFGDFTYTFSNFTGSASGAQSAFTASGFGASILGSDATGSTFDFTVSTTSPRFFTSSSFTNGIGDSSITSVPTVPDSYDPFTVTSVSGTYTFDSNLISPGFFGSQGTTTFTTDVPVPLPIVGAGLAFGFTRKLRKRAKTVA